MRPAIADANRTCFIKIPGFRSGGVRVAALTAQARRRKGARKDLLHAARHQLLIARIVHEEDEHEALALAQNGDARFALEQLLLTLGGGEIHLLLVPLDYDTVDAPGAVMGRVAELETRDSFELAGKILGLLEGLTIQGGKIQLCVFFRGQPDADNLLASHFERSSEGVGMGI